MIQQLPLYGGVVQRGLRFDRILLVFGIIFGLVGFMIPFLSLAFL